MSFPVKVAERPGERRALVCVPKGQPPFAAVVFNHGSIVDMLGWPGATQRGYRLDRVCEALAAEGYFVFAPIRENSARGRGFREYEDAYREIVLQAVDHVKTLAGVDGSRIALAGFSMGGVGVLQSGAGAQRPARGGAARSGVRARAAWRGGEECRQHKRAGARHGRAKRWGLLRVAASSNPAFERDAYRRPSLLGARNQD